MNRKELSDAVAKRLGVMKSEGDRVTEAVLDAIAEEMKRGGEVRLTGFGIFDVRHSPARKGRNPRAGTEIDIPAKNAPRFRPAKQLKEAVS